MTPKLTIAIPSYNCEKVIKQAIESALAQEYPLKEIVVVDDGSTDNTVKVAQEYSQVRVIAKDKNEGIGPNLARCMKEAKGRYVLYLCADDYFADPYVASDVVKIFDSTPDVGVIGRYYYQFLDGFPGAVMVERNKNILLNAINPSGMAFRNREVPVSNRIFIEMPSMVYEFIKFTKWTMIEYDTVAVRLQPLQNTGCKASYYKESPIQVLTDFYGKDFKYHLNLIQLKNRAPKILWREICLTVKLNRSVLLEPIFWFSAITAVSIPRSLLIPLCNFWRHRVSRNLVFTIPRP